MSTNCLYTAAELIEKIKALDVLLDEGSVSDMLDTGQTKHDMRFSVRAYREQKEAYTALLQKCYPATYKSYFGSSVLKFRGPGC